MARLSSGSIGMIVAVLSSDPSGSENTNTSRVRLFRVMNSTNSSTSSSDEIIHGSSETTRPSTVTEWSETICWTMPGTERENGVSSPNDEHCNRHPNNTDPLSAQAAAISVVQYRCGISLSASSSRAAHATGFCNMTAEVRCAPISSSVNDLPSHASFGSLRPARRLSHIRQLRRTDSKFFL